jgi:hypothetical protein
MKPPMERMVRLMFRGPPSSGLVRFTGDRQVDEVKIPNWAISSSGQVEPQDALRQIDEESLALEGEHDFKCKGTYDLGFAAPAPATGHHHT